jgi:hypothetical protein
VKKPKPNVKSISRDRENKFDIREAEAAKTLDLKDLDDCERAKLATCQKILRRDTGCNSPFEEFFGNLVFQALFGRWPTPDDVASKLETFKDNFESMQRDARSFLEAYPEERKASETEQPAEAAHA